MFQIKPIAKEEIDVIIPFLQLLDSKLTEQELAPRLQLMLANNYHCIGVYDQNKLVAISGFWFIQKYYTGKYLEPDNVVIEPSYRRHGIGQLLSDWLDKHALENNCVALNLNVYASNHNAIKFWLNKGYNIISFHLQKKII
jgi:diamine N-acetyltransferase